MQPASIIYKWYSTSDIKDLVKQIRVVILRPAKNVFDDLPLFIPTLSISLVVDIVCVLLSQVLIEQPLPPTFRLSNHISMRLEIIA